MRLGATAPMIFTGSSCVRKRAEELDGACNGTADASVSAAGTGNDIHGHSLWNSICDDGFNLTEQSVGNHICKEEPEKMESIMTLDRVGASYDGKPALENISMEIFPHSITAIIVRPDAENQPCFAA